MENNQFKGQQEAPSIAIQNSQHEMCFVLCYCALNEGIRKGERLPFPGSLSLVF